MFQNDSAPWLIFYAWNTDQSPKNDLVYNTSGISIVVVRDNLANSSALTLSAASGPTDWAAGKFWPMGGNKYRVGIPTALITSFTGQISVEGTYTGGTIDGVIREVSAYDPTKNPLSPLVAGRQLAVSATTGKVTAEAVELDSATRVKLDASQPDYAPATATALAAAKTILDKVDTGLVVDGAVYQFTANMLELGPSGGGGGDATLAKQTEILAAIQGSAVIQVASPNVSGNLVLTQGDDYDGVANPKASWTVTTDYTSGWTVRLTIRSSTDAIIYTNTGTVVSSTVVAVTIAAPTGLTMTGCPGQWQGKFDVELTHSSGKKKTIALGVCYINEDQTR